MGLDMYLTAKRYFSDYIPVEKEIKTALDAALNCSLGDISEVTINVGYWRKANAIHNWFVNTVQDGIDECQTVEVSRENLVQLLATVTLVLDDHSLAKELLPPQSGFFFGSDLVDEYYIESLEDTKSILDRILSDESSKNWSFYYHSSW